MTTPQVPIAAQLAAAILGVGLLSSDQEHCADLEAEAELMNQELRELEARKMSQTTSALKYAEAELRHIVKAAAAASADLMEKDAIGVPGWSQVAQVVKNSPLARGLGRIAPAAEKSLGGAAQAAGRLLPDGGKMQKAWGGLSTKAKLLGTAAVLGTGYAGYKGLQAGRDYMKSQHQGVYGAGSPPIMRNVNEYGYPEY